MLAAGLRRAALAASALLVLTSPLGAAPSAAATTTAKDAAAPAAASSPAAAALSADAARVALREAIWGLERSLRHRLLAGGAGPELSRLEELLGVLRDSGRRLAGADGTDLARKADALETLLHEVGRREGARGAAQPSASAWEPAASGKRLDGAGGATCGNALAVGDGQLAAPIAPSGGGAGSEVWLRYTAAAAGAVAVSTAGSDLDTVVEVYDACPPAGTPPLARGDDEIGLQARASFRAAAGETKWIRVGGWDGATGTAAVTLAGGLGGFEGTVTNEATGQRLSNRFVQVWNAAGSYLTNVYTGSDGSYFFAAWPDTYFASTRANSSSVGLLDELYDDVPCAGGPPTGCSPTAGTPIQVQGVVVHGVDFALGPGAAIAGRVRDATTGLPLVNVDVAAYNPGGGYVSGALTDQAGRFLLDGLATGVAFAVATPTSFDPVHRRELYQDLPCAAGCNVTTGTPISVVDGQTTPGIDFSLERYGAIAGTVTRVSDGSPVSFVNVDVVDAQGNPRSYGYTDAAGEYQAGGLHAGTYFAVTQTHGAFADELYDDVSCVPSCDPADGAPLSVTLGATTSGVDFALRRNATISGHLTDALSGDPIEHGPFSYSGFVTVFDVSGNPVNTGYGQGGQYQIVALPPGTYYLIAASPFYLGELYDDLPCPASCDPTMGTGVTVALDGEVTGIDFAMTPFGSIAGTVTDSVTGEPLDVLIQVWNTSGQLTAAVSSPGGAFLVKGLADGTYFVTATHPELVGELYANLPCPGGPPAGCTPASGTGVTVAVGTIASGVDFVLARGGRIAGTVRNASTMAPIGYASIRIFNGAGAQVALTGCDGDGTYEVAGLDAGNHFVVADSDEHDAEVYGGLLCPSAACNPTIGTPVPVALGATTAGVDFELSRSGGITGVVTAMGGGTPVSTPVYLYDAAGHLVDEAWSDSEGRYGLTAEPGTWYLRASGRFDYVTQLYSGIPCPGDACVVTTGTPVIVSSGATTAGIDFALAGARGIVGRVVDTSGHPLAGVAIDLWSSIGSHVIAGTTGPSGYYQIFVDPGTYFVSTDSNMGAVEEVWNDVPCPLGPAYTGQCDPTTGDAVTLSSSSSLVAGIDFTLEGVDILFNGFEPGDRAWSAWTP